MDQDEDKASTAAQWSLLSPESVFSLLPKKIFYFLLWVAAIGKGSIFLDHVLQNVGTGDMTSWDRILQSAPDVQGRLEASVEIFEGFPSDIKKKRKKHFKPRYLYPLLLWSMSHGVNTMTDFFRWYFKDMNHDGKPCWDRILQNDKEAENRLHKSVMALLRTKDEEYAAGEIALVRAKLEEQNLEHVLQTDCAKGMEIGGYLPNTRVLNALPAVTNSRDMSCPIQAAKTSPKLATQASLEEPPGSCTEKSSLKTNSSSIIVEVNADVPESEALLQDEQQPGTTESPTTAEKQKKKEMEEPLALKTQTPEDGARDKHDDISKPVEKKKLEALRQESQPEEVVGEGDDIQDRSVIPPYLSVIDGVESDVEDTGAFSQTDDSIFQAALNSISPINTGARTKRPLQAEIPSSSPVYEVGETPESQSSPFHVTKRVRFTDSYSEPSQYISTATQTDLPANGLDTPASELRILFKVGQTRKGIQIPIKKGSVIVLDARDAGGLLSDLVES